MEDADTRVLVAVSEQLERLRQGEPGEPVTCEPQSEPTVRDLCEGFNRLFTAVSEAHAFVNALAEGKLDVELPPRNLFASPYKQLHASLLHLRWQAWRVAEGDYGQRTHFLGDISAAFNAMVEALEEKERLEASLHATRDRLQQLEGIIPICSFCMRIRDEGELWKPVEEYFAKYTEAKFSHGVCPSCFKKHYGWPDEGSES